MLEFEDIAVGYVNGTRALEPTSLKIARGAITVLLGSSDAGNEQTRSAAAGRLESGFE